MNEHVRCRNCGEWFEAERQWGAEANGAHYQLTTGVCPHCGFPYWAGRYGCVVAPVIEEKPHD